MMARKPCLRIVGLSQTERSLLASILRGHGFEVVEADGASSWEVPTLEPCNILTQRQVQVLRALRRYGSREMTARSLGIALKTVDAHLEHIYKRAGVRTRIEALCWACRRGLLDEDRDACEGSGALPQASSDALA